MSNVSHACNNMNLMNFLTYEHNELNMLIHEQREAVNYNSIVSWLKPTRTYANSSDYQIVQHYSSYTDLLENVIDRIYLILNIVYIKLEKLTATCRTFVKKPVRLTIASLGRVIIDKLSDFNKTKNAGRMKYQRDMDCQTATTIKVLKDNANTVLECNACVILFKCLNNITHNFKDSLKLLKSNNARAVVRSNLYEYNNSQSMQTMCKSIAEDMELFLKNNQAVNESHAALNKQHDNLIDDYIDYIAECDAVFARHEEDSTILASKVQALHNAFTSKLLLLDDSFARVFVEVERFMAETNLQQDNAQRINNNTLNCALQRIAQHLNTFNSCTSVILEKIITSIDICAERMLLLQSLLQHLQVRVVAMQENQECVKSMNCTTQTCVENWDMVTKDVVSEKKDPVRDMLSHIEMNKALIKDLQNENVTLQRTIERIKKAVKC